MGWGGKILCCCGYGYQQQKGKGVDYLMIFGVSEYRLLGCRNRFSVSLLQIVSISSVSRMCNCLVCRCVFRVVLICVLIMLLMISSSVSIILMVFDDIVCISVVQVDRKVIWNNDVLMMILVGIFSRQIIVGIMMKLSFMFIRVFNMFMVVLISSIGMMLIYSFDVWNLIFSGQ